MEHKQALVRATGELALRTPEPWVRVLPSQGVHYGGGIGRRHGGLALFCLYANPCMHSVQDLNRLTCFCNFWNHEIWRFLFWVGHEDLFFFSDLRLGMV